MLVPNVEDAKIINEKIVFNDNVLPLKEEAPNLKLSTIENISEYSLETCIKTVLEYNLDVSFHTIQYSKEKKKVYFYADRIISKKGWEDINNFQYTNLKTSKDVLEEIKRLFNSEKSISPNHISLYEVNALLTKEVETLSKKQKYYDTKLKNAFINEFDSDMYAHFSLSYRSPKTISIIFSPTRFSSNFEIKFSKNDNDLYITKSEYEQYNFKILHAAKDLISKAYDELTNFFDLITTKRYQIKSVNSNFMVDISEEYVELQAKIIATNKEIFSLANYAKRYSFEKKGYVYNNCSSSDLIDLLNKNEDEMFKRVFIKIEDCPKWMQEELYCIRQNELTEQRRMNENQKHKDEKKSNEKTKKIHLKRNFLTFGRQKKDV